jgi:hypothetical protein
LCWSRPRRAGPRPETEAKATCHRRHPASPLPSSCVPAAAALLRRAWWRQGARKQAPLTGARQRHAASRAARFRAALRARLCVSRGGPAAGARLRGAWLSWQRHLCGWVRAAGSAASRPRRRAPVPCGAGPADTKRMLQRAGPLGRAPMKPRVSGRRDCPQRAARQLLTADSRQQARDRGLRTCFRSRHCAS